MAVLLVALVVFAFYINQNGDLAPTDAEKTQIARDESYLNDLPEPTATAQVVAKPSPAKSVVIGDLDFTKNQNAASGANIVQNLKFNSAEEEARFYSNDPCAIAGLDNSWSDPFQKTMCGMTRFIGNQIIEPLDQMACNFSGAALAANYGSNITAKYVEGKCYILDRK